VEVGEGICGPVNDISVCDVAGDGEDCVFGGVVALHMVSELGALHLIDGFNGAGNGPADGLVTVDGVA